MFSATESGIDMIAISQEVPENETKNNEEPDEKPTQDTAVVNGPIYMGEPGEALPLRTDPDWHPTVQPVRLVFVYGSPSPTWVTFISQTDLETMYHTTPIMDITMVAEIPPWLSHRYLITKYDVRDIDCRPRDAEEYSLWLGPDAYESYIVDHEFYLPEYTYVDNANDIRINQRRHTFVHPTGGPYEATMDSDDEPEANFEVASSYEDRNDSDANDMVYSVEASHARTIEHRIVVDSGASAHMTGASEHLFDTKPCNRQVVVANDNVTVATTMGKLNISTPSHTTLTLTDVLLIKGMSTTLLSIPACGPTPKSVWNSNKTRVQFCSVPSPWRALQ
ncbi:hypothetical protein H310_13018 [Aphanomyces invadans]|uniref:Retrovirus-related Pol polyprotein from transposon TNT 1-94-like beta-barrel domain-containing protein n=1 Tax=Aphanomyces invadans TaxID=157072 RepID=A0A024TF70_9STRA|nr:hypothetical protein H310_13018 [Aphanomyces invadans]ETV92805.1 hypothetical protein H310_13018 [Aphanomyces invadans]|eukprot:XP_008878575.1 hypothetical protein H310_13018 [Aphanomyces invadans]